MTFNDVIPDFCELEARYRYIPDISIVVCQPQVCPSWRVYVMVVTLSATQDSLIARKLLAVLLVTVESVSFAAHLWPGLVRVIMNNH
jgi:hypothetical protein